MTRTVRVDDRGERVVGGDVIYLGSGCLELGNDIRIEFTVSRGVNLLRREC